MTPTDFQKAVWSHVRQIPPGKVTTYGNMRRRWAGRSRRLWRSEGRSRSVRPMCPGGESYRQAATASSPATSVSLRS